MWLAEVSTVFKERVVPCVAGGYFGCMKERVVPCVAGGCFGCV